MSQVSRQQRGEPNDLSNDVAPARRRRGAGGGAAVRRRNAAGEVAARQCRPVAARGPAVPGLRSRTHALPLDHPRAGGPPSARRARRAGRSHRRRRGGRPGVADVRAAERAGLRCVAVAQRRGRLHRVAGVDRVRRERRSAHRAGHAGHRRRRGGPELARRGAAHRPDLIAGRAGRVSGLGDRQQFDAQGLALGRHLDRGGQGTLRRSGQSHAGARAGGAPSGLAERRRRDGRGAAGLRREPDPVCRRAAPSGRGTHRRLLFGGSVLRRAAGADHRRTRDAGAAGSGRPDGDRCLVAPDRAPRALARARRTRARARTHA